MDEERWRDIAVRTGSDERLVEAIRGEIARAGRISFARFMELALYHPEHGYYLRPAVRAGKQGDFLTAPELSPFFGRILARQLVEVWTALGTPAEFVAIEYGAGRGRLAHDILAAVREECPRFAMALRYVLHELNPHRRADAAALLGTAGFDARASFEWPGSESVLVPPVTGAILANEFLDALPVHRGVWRGGVLLERFVGWSGEWFIEELGLPATGALAGAITAAGVELAEGQCVDITLAAGDWLASTAGRLARGVVLAIDYGYPSAELYAPQRHAGTFLCYHQHTANDEPYARIGRQDMTAHVDFGLLCRAGAAAGLALAGETTQSQFLTNLGLGELLVASQTPGRDLASYLTDRSAVFSLVDPRGMGGFRVQMQGRGLDLPLPRGFRDDSGRRPV